MDTTNLVMPKTTEVIGGTLDGASGVFKEFFVVVAGMGGVVFGPYSANIAAHVPTDADLISVPELPVGWPKADKMAFGDNAVMAQDLIGLMQQHSGRPLGKLAAWRHVCPNGDTQLASRYDVLRLMDFNQVWDALIALFPAQENTSAAAA